MFISTTTLTSSPSDLTAVGQKQEACSSIGLLARQSPSDRPLTTPSSTTLSMAIRQPNWSEADTLYPDNHRAMPGHDGEATGRPSNPSPFATFLIAMGTYPSLFCPVC